MSFTFANNSFNCDNFDDQTTQLSHHVNNIVVNTYNDDIWNIDYDIHDNIFGDEKEQNYNNPFMISESDIEDDADPSNHYNPFAIYEISNVNESAKYLIYAFCHLNNNHIIIPDDVILLCLKYCVTLESFDKNISSKEFEINILNDTAILCNFASPLRSLLGTTVGLFTRNTIKHGTHHWKLQLFTSICEFTIKIGFISTDQILHYGKQAISKAINQNFFLENCVSFGFQQQCLSKYSLTCYDIDLYLDLANQYLGYSLYKNPDGYIYCEKTACPTDIDDGYRMFIVLSPNNKDEDYDFKVKILSYNNISKLQKRIEKNNNDIHAYSALIDAVDQSEKLRLYKLAYIYNPGKISCLNQTVIKNNLCYDAAMYHISNEDLAEKQAIKYLEWYISIHDVDIDDIDFTNRTFWKMKNAYYFTRNFENSIKLYEKIDFLVLAAINLNAHVSDHIVAVESYWFLDDYQNVVKICDSYVDEQEIIEYDIADIVGDSYHQVGKYKRAITYFKLHLNKHPKDVECIHCIAYCYYNVNNMDQSSIYVKMVLDIDPNMEVAYDSEICGLITRDSQYLLFVMKHKEFACIYDCNDL